MFSRSYINATLLGQALTVFLLLNGVTASIGAPLKGAPPDSFEDEREAAMSYSQGDDGPRPSPKLSPEEVVGLQLKALQENDTPARDSGIAIAFRFASPANQAATGPLENFILLVKNPLYRLMLNHRSAERRPMKIDGDRAEQRVTLTSASGERGVYIFTLSKQTEGPFKDCWMTDGVERLRGDGQLKGEQVAGAGSRRPDPFSRA